MAHHQYVVSNLVPYTFTTWLITHSFDCISKEEEIHKQTLSSIEPSSLEFSQFDFFWNLSSVEWMPMNPNDWTILWLVFTWFTRRGNSKSVQFMTKLKYQRSEETFDIMTCIPTDPEHETDWILRFVLAHMYIYTLRVIDNSFCSSGCSGRNMFKGDELLIQSHTKNYITAINPWTLFVPNLS